VDVLAELQSLLALGSRVGREPKRRRPDHDFTWSQLRDSERILCPFHGHRDLPQQLLPVNHPPQVRCSEICSTGLVSCLIILVNSVASQEKCKSIEWCKHCK